MATRETFTYEPNANDRQYRRRLDPASYECIVQARHELAFVKGVLETLCEDEDTFDILREANDKVTFVMSLLGTDRMEGGE